MARRNIKLSKSGDCASTDIQHVNSDDVRVGIICRYKDRVPSDVQMPHERVALRKRLSISCDGLSLCLSRLANHEPDKYREIARAIDEIAFDVNELRKSGVAYDKAADHEKSIENQMRIVRSVS